MDAVVGIYGRYDWEDRFTPELHSRAQARSFVEQVRAVSHSKVGYLELRGAGRGYGLIDGERTREMAHAAALFLNQVYRNRRRIGAKEVV